MRNRPLAIWIISVLYMSIAPLGFAYLFFRAGFQVEPFFKYMRWDLSLVLIGGSVVGYGVYKVRPWGYIAFIGYSAALVMAMSFKHILNPTTFSYTTVVSIIAVIGGIAAFIQKHFAAPYFNPHLRWWETDIRFQTELKVSLVIDGTETSVRLKDISRSGCFVAANARVVPGDIVKVKITLLDFEFESEARTIRVSEKLDGLGLMFLDLDANQKKVVKGIIDYLNTQKAPSRDIVASA